MDRHEIDTSGDRPAEVPFAPNFSHDPTSLQQLEFFRVMENINALLQTPYGPERLQALDFGRDADTVRTELQKVTEMQDLLASGDHVPLEGFGDIRPHLSKIRPLETFLEATELLVIQNHLQCMAVLRRFLEDRQKNAPLLYKYALRIHLHREIDAAIGRKIDHSGEVFDHASPQLREIRIRIRQLESESKRLLAKLHKQYEQYSQEGIITLRDGRLVLGIQPAYVNKINGIVHGTSGSGATVFIEPMETLKISNEIQNLRLQERREIIKILRALTELIRQVRDDLFFAIENIAILDVIHGKARLAQKMEATAPKIATARYLKLSEARHPLLLLKTGKAGVVSLSLELGKDFDTLVITGPNAGGKTVTMKTVGLLVLMTQAAIPIPAGPDSEIPLLHKILVDIGDRQSLEQDLSTFSAHVVRLREILEKADRNSLVLLDEVGTGTDPKEGAALAMALLAELTARGALTIATTHHGELKAFAHEHPRVENGSMEFDLATLRPTYRLRIGIPGSSYALEIARRYGLPDSLLGHAQKIIGEEKDKLEDLILSLETRLQALEKEQRELSIERSRSAALRQLYERQLAEYKANQATLKKEAEAQARKILQEANALIENTVREIRESGASRQSIKTAKQRLRQAREALEKSSPAEAPSPPPPLSRGDRVWIESLRETGELLEDPGDRSKVRVLVGNVTLMLDVSGIRPTDKTPVSEKPGRTITPAEIDTVGETVLPELDLRGLDSHDAIIETDRYLDQALESGWEEVRIVHGKGTGTLRRAVNDFLARDKRVESKRLGRWGEGDTGVTVVKLKTD